MDEKSHKAAPVISCVIFFLQEINLRYVPVVDGKRL